MSTTATGCTRPWGPLTVRLMLAQTAVLARMASPKKTDDGDG